MLAEKAYAVVTNERIRTRGDDDRYSLENCRNARSSRPENLAHTDLYFTTCPKGKTNEYPMFPAQLWYINSVVVYVVYIDDEATARELLTGSAVRAGATGFSTALLADT